MQVTNLQESGKMFSNFFQYLLRRNESKYIFIFINQLKIQKYRPLNFMSELIPEFQEYKELIPEFITKLYHILQNKQYEDYLCWSADDEILIKSGKKLEDKVLPHFFRHKHISSFIRQLNMYKFSKVTKLTKQRNFMYFKNEYFQKGKIKQLTKIKRNNKKNRQANEYSTPSKSCDDEVSLMLQGSQENMLLTNYKGEVKRSFNQIKQILAKVMEKYPQTTLQLASAKNICEQIMEGQECDQMSPREQQYHMDTFSEQFQKNDVKNMLTTEKYIPKLDSIMFTSQLSFNNFM